MPNLTLSWSEVPTLETVVCDSIPCEIHHTGKANTDKYFESTVSSSKEDSKRLNASFRGRPLNGIRVDLPDQFTGLVCNKEKANKRNDIKLNAIKEFHTLTLWNYDCKPTENDTAVQALKWLEVSSAIHQPVVKEELDRDLD
ncbi:uncharacterized protein LOC141858603 [Brevipalpus obovatus]|uniref:uncharacterized protein LOC141858603 n=1 Tax=Brevipalpus obovatus TaxID=246614 RepID=UPI003D9EAB3D